MHKSRAAGVMLVLIASVALPSGCSRNTSDDTLFVPGTNKLYSANDSCAYAVDHAAQSSAYLAEIYQAQRLAYFIVVGKRFRAPTMSTSLQRRAVVALRRLCHGTPDDPLSVALSVALAEGDPVLPGIPEPHVDHSVTPSSR
jgi:hypothetical protein